MLFPSLVTLATLAIRTYWKGESNHLELKFFLQKKSYYLNQFLLIWILSIIGNLFLLFLSFRIHELPLLISLFSFFLFILFFGFIAHIGIKLLIKTDLNSLKPHSFLKTDLLPSLSGAALAIVVIFILSRILIKIPTEDMTFLDSSPLWAKIISSFYSGINLEILFRLFFLTLIYFSLRIFFKNKDIKNYLAWIAILIAALAPMSLNFFSTDHLTLSRLLISTIIGGVVYGYLFVYKSFWAASMAHFLVDFLLNGK
jgi:hypothetical protein